MDVPPGDAGGVVAGGVETSDSGQLSSDGMAQGERGRAAAAAEGERPRGARGARPPPATAPGHQTPRA
eukprot:2312200-Pyramimonas_sp.AAC.1